MRPDCFAVQKSPDALGTVLTPLIGTAERRLASVSADLAQAQKLNAPTNQLREKEHVLSHAEYRVKLLRRMKLGFDHASK